VFLTSPKYLIPLYVNVLSAILNRPVPVISTAFVFLIALNALIAAASPPFPLTAFFAILEPPPVGAKSIPIVIKSD
jgi:hypothetical protein